MKVISASVSLVSGKAVARADVDVPTLGVVKMLCPLSDALYKKIEKEILEEVKTKIKKSKVAGESPYGFCPVCGGLGVSRESRLRGNDSCVNGHTYPSSSSVRTGTKGVKPWSGVVRVSGSRIPPHYSGGGE